MFGFDGILRKPCLLQPCFHVAGFGSGKRKQAPDRQQIMMIIIMIMFIMINSKPTMIISQFIIINHDGIGRSGAHGRRWTVNTLQAQNVASSPVVAYMCILYVYMHLCTYVYDICICVYICIQYMPLCIYVYCLFLSTIQKNENKLSNPGTTLSDISGIHKYLQQTYIMNNINQTNSETVNYIEDNHENNHLNDDSMQLLY